MSTEKRNESGARKQKRANGRRAEKLVDLEVILADTREALIYDLLPPEIGRRLVRGTRDQIPVHWNLDPDMFKRVQQCNLFDKRIIWTSDKGFDELAMEAFKGFVDSQKTFGLPEPMNKRETLVVSEAARIVKLILGKFSVEKWLDSCSFGKRAAVDLPRAICYLDTRLERLCGSFEQIQWLRAYLCRDVHLLRAVRQRRRRKKFTQRYRIEATAVPKTHKSARIVFPDTSIGGFLSRGLGEYVRMELECATNIDLEFQQERHKYWARQASLTGESATIDMRKASDSFVKRHIELLCPSDWHDALEVVRTPKCKVGTDNLDLKSYMLMGSGHTFPLQTLLFYSLAKATCNLMKVKGRVSVYGDDIIVPTRAARCFISVMSSLGFSINTEKSFFDAHDPEMPSQTLFRESCGGDYKGGCDVRPYMPECDLQSGGSVPRSEAASWCHRLINGLLDRWSAEEIPLTVQLLLQSINMRCGFAIHFVPPWEPDHSGVRHSVPKRLQLGLDVQSPQLVGGWAYYRKLSLVKRKRKRDDRERPYYWYALRSASLGAKDVMDLYSEAVSVTGEDLKVDKGQFRWVFNRNIHKEILVRRN